MTAEPPPPPEPPPQPAPSPQSEAPAPDRRTVPEAAVRDHLANERTLLAWQRTALTVIGLGFLVDRFAFQGASMDASSLLGLALIGLGGVVALVGAWRFVRTEREIDTATYRPALLTHLLLTGAIVAGAVLLAIYLVTAS